MADFAWQEFDIRYASAHRRHGDPFPLPRLGQPRRSEPLTQRVDAALRSLNQLSSAVFQPTKPSPTMPLTHVQKWMMQSVARRVSAYGPRPDQLSEEQALREMRERANLYEQEDKNVVLADLDRIKILQRKLSPLPASELASPEARFFLDSFDVMIERSTEELEALRRSSDLVEPYWDRGLKQDKSRRIKLYQQLWTAGLLDFRRRRKARVGIFTVRKKGNWQRLIVDARQANALQRTPPTARLATAAGLASLDLSYNTLVSSGFSDVLPEPAGETGDVGDCFYNFKINTLTSWFATDDIFTPRELQTLGIHFDHVYDDEARGVTPVELDEPLYACFSGVPMGWSWALWLAQDIVSYQTLQALNLPFSSLIQDKRPPPQVEPMRPAVGVYVDNVHVFAGKPAEAGEAMRKVEAHFTGLGIPFETDHVAGKTFMDTLGLRFEFGDEVRVRARPDRAWNLWAATRALLHRRRISGDILRVWLGHINFHFQLCRPALSAISACYKFASEHLGHRYPMWPSVRRELRIALGLIFLAEKSLSARVSSEVHLGDSSDRGYALMVTEASEKQIRQEMQFREKWRFLVNRDPLPHPPPSKLAAADELGDPDSGCLGSRPHAGLGSCTLYGVQLAKKYDEEVPKKSFYQKKTRLFGKPTEEKPSMIEVQPPPEVASLWKDATRWDLLVSAPWRYVDEHINLKEARVCLMGLRRLCRTRRNLGCLALSLTDNLVSALVFEKGRSSAGSLNALCKRAAAYQLGGEIQWRLRHIRSEDNTADAPSRRWGPDVKKQQRQNVLPPFLGVHMSTDSLEQAGGEANAKSSFWDSAKGLQSHTARPPGRRPRYFLELFSGAAVLTRAIREVGLRTFPDVDLSKGKEFDLTLPSVQKYIFSLIRSRAVWWVHLGTPCTVFSRARHNIKNYIKARKKEAIGVACALFSALLIKECFRYNVYFSLDNPLGSRLWEFEPIQEILKDRRVFFARFSMCAYGAMYKKPTGLLTNCRHFLDLHRDCPRGHKHLPLRGTEKVKAEGKFIHRSRTLGANQYPAPLTEEWAQTAFLAAPLEGHGKTSWAVKNDFEINMREAAIVDGIDLNSQLGTGKAPRDLQNSEQRIREAIKYITQNQVIFGQQTSDALKYKHCEHLQTGQVCEKEGAMRRSHW